MGASCTSARWQWPFRMPRPHAIHSLFLPRTACCCCSSLPPPLPPSLLQVRYDPDATGPRYLLEAVRGAGYAAEPYAEQRLGEERGGEIRGGSAGLPAFRALGRGLRAAM